GFRRRPLACTAQAGLTSCPCSPARPAGPVRRVPPATAITATDESGASMPSVNVLTDIVINRPAPAGSPYAAAPSNAPAWYVNIESARWQTPPPLRSGARVGFTAHFLGRRLEYTYEIAEFIPGERLVMRTAQGPFPMETTYTWAPAGNGATRMTLRNRGEPAGLSTILAPLLPGAGRRAQGKDLARLKSILEAT